MRFSTRPLMWHLCAGLAVVTMLASCGTETVTATVVPAPSPTVTPTPSPIEPTPLPTVTALVEPAPRSTPPPPTSVPTTQPAAEPVLPVPCAGPPIDQWLRLEVIDVAPDDVDGGLVVHTGPGISTPIVGVLPWDASGINYISNNCERLASGAEWWLVSAPGNVDGWVNSRYLGDRTVAADRFDATPCVSAAGPASFEAVGGERASTTSDGRIAIVDIDVVSSRECDRVVITLGQGWNFFASSTTSIPAFPKDLIAEVRTTSSEFELSFTKEVVSAIDSVWYTEDWRDVATNEQNVALAFDRRDRTSLYVGWGTGDAAVRYLDAPARIVIDITQRPTDEGMIAGPIVGPAILFDPIQADEEGPGVTLPIVVRGYSRGFEASSVFSLAEWDQRDTSHPFKWDGELFGGAPNLAAEVAFHDARRSVPFPFMTSGFFEFVIADLEPGGYQIAVSPTTGCYAPVGTGQQFRVAEAASTGRPADTADGLSPATTFALSFDITPPSSAEFVVDAADERRTMPTDVIPC